MTWDYSGQLDTVAPEELPEEWVIERLRLRRDALLAASDARVTGDNPGDVDAWMTYRQALRDLPASNPDPRLVVWPEPPTSTTPHPNRVAVMQAARDALQTDREFLALQSPSQAQSLAQIRALTRQNVGIIRLLLNQLDGTD